MSDYKWITWLGKKWRRSIFHGELRFIQFADYESYGPTIMIYTQDAWDRAQRGDNPGPIGFLVISKLPKMSEEAKLAQIRDLFRDDVAEYTAAYDVKADILAIIDAPASEGEKQ